MGRNHRLFFATDVHGSEICFRKFLNAPKLYQVDTLVLGGDITGKVIVPIVETAPGKFVTTFLDIKQEFDQDKVKAFEEKITNSGYYPYRTTEDQMSSLKSNQSNVDKLFLQLMIERLESWVKLTEETFKDQAVVCYITGGNDDPYEISEALNKSKRVQDPEEKVVQLDDEHEMISLGYSNPTPWKLPRDVSEEVLAEKIEAMTSRVGNMANCVFNLHVPPKESMLDQCPLLDGSVDPPKPVSSGGQPVFAGAGSKAVLDAIQKHQPLLGLHGHIHESRAAQKFGRTLCLNPGSEYSEGILRGAIVTYNEKKILSYQFTSG